MHITMTTFKQELSSSPLTVVELIKYEISLTLKTIPPQGAEKQLIKANVILVGGLRSNELLRNQLYFPSQSFFLQTNGSRRSQRWDSQVSLEQCGGGLLCFLVQPTSRQSWLPPQLSGGL